MFFFASYPTTRYNRPLHQVLTGTLPYEDSDDQREIALRVVAGGRPTRPTDPSQNRWLPVPVWDVIATGWRSQPKQRCKLSVMHQVFLPPGQQGILGVNPGNLNARNDGNLHDS